MSAASFLSQYDRTIAARTRRDNMSIADVVTRMKTRRRSITPRRDGVPIGTKRIEKRANERRIREREPGRLQLHSARYYSADGFTGHHVRFVTIGTRK